MFWMNDESSTELLRELSGRPPSSRRDLEKTSKGNRTRDRLMQTGRKVLEEKGYFDSTVTDITRQSGVALGTFYRYFKNKDEVFLLLLEDLVAELYTSTAGAWSGTDIRLALQSTTTSYLRAYFANRKLILGLLQMASANPDCAQLWWHLRKATHDRMEKYLAKAIDASPSEVSLRAAALAGMVEQFAYHWYVEAERQKLPLPSLDQAAQVLSDIWYQAIYRQHDEHGTQPPSTAGTTRVHSDSADSPDGPQVAVTQP
jgi:AcrR family transcriptional regulator